MNKEGGSYAQVDLSILFQSVDFRYAVDTESAPMIAQPFRAVGCPARQQFN